MRGKREEAEVVLFGEIVMNNWNGKSVPGGSALHVGRHLAAFGMRPLLISRVGRDPAGAQLLAACHRFGIHTVGIQRDPERATGQAELAPAGSGVLHTLAANPAFDAVALSGIPALLARLRPALIYFGSLSQRGLYSRHTLDALLELLAVPRLVDLNLRDTDPSADVLERSLARADMLKLNLHELYTVATHLGFAADRPSRLAEAIVRHYRLQWLLVGSGAEGAFWIDGEGRLLQAASLPYPKPAVGGGDALCAVFLYGMRQGWPPGLTLERACAFARDVCTLEGGVPAGPAFYRPYLESWAG